jgi:hypothetical protein
MTHPTGERFAAERPIPDAPPPMPGEPTGAEPPDAHDATRRTVPFVEPLPATDIVAEARARGRTDAQSGAVDVWMFDESHTLPYLEQLPARLAHEIQDRAERRAELIRVALNAERDRSNDTVRDAALRRDDRERYQQLFAEATERVRRALQRLDRMARFEAWRRETRHLIEFTNAARNPGPVVDPAEIDGDDPGTAYDDHVEGLDDATEELDEDEEIRPAARDRRFNPYVDTLGTDVDELLNVPWEGHSPTPLPARVRVLALIALVCVDLPIQFLVFRNFQLRTSEGFVETIMLTLPTAVVMILLPHFAGVFFRVRQSTGRERFRTVLAILLLVPWIGLGVILGILRSNVLSIRQTDARGNELPIPNVAEQFGVSPLTISIMFVTILMLTGGVALLLGLAHQHPYVDAYVEAFRDRQDAQAHVGMTEPDIPVQPALMLTEQEAREREALGDEALRLAFIDAEYAYLDGLAEGMTDPAATEAIGRFARRRTEERRAAAIAEAARAADEADADPRSPSPAAET